MGGRSDENEADQGRREEHPIANGELDFPEVLEEKQPFSENEKRYNDPGNCGQFLTPFFKNE